MFSLRALPWLAITAICGFTSIATAKASEDNPLADLPMRHIGSALMSGRISDFAFYPGGNQAFITGVSSGGVFRTTNGGTTWEPLFDGEASYAIGVVEIDPNDSDTLWVEPVRTTRSAVSRRVMAFISRSMVGSLGPIWGSRTRVISVKSGLTLGFR